MKLNAKFSLALSLFIVINTLLSCWLIFTFSRVIEMRKYQVHTANAVIEWLNLRNYLIGVYTISLDTATVDTEWASKRKEFEQAIEGIETSPYSRILSNEASELYDKTKSLYGLIRGSFPSIESALSSISKANLSPSIKSHLKSAGFAAVNYTSNDTDAGKVQTLFFNFSSAIYNLNNASGPFQTAFEEYRDKLDQEIDTRIRNGILQVIAILAGIVILMFISITRMTGGIVARLHKIEGLTGRLASKDLTVNVLDTIKDEIGQLGTHLNQTVNTLASFMVSVKKTADEATGMGESISFASSEVTSATTEISANIRSMDMQFENLKASVDRSVSALDSMSTFLVTVVQDIERQEQAIGESAKAIGEMNTSITAISDQGRRKSAQMSELKEAAEEGERKIGNTESLLTGVTEQLDAVASFIGIINSIAEQTSILSMNAAIESAHAGEAGKGFAVVADEIQKLAESTSENSQMITTTLTEVIANVQQARESSTEATRAFSGTFAAIDDLIRTLNDIVQSITEIDSRSGRIAESSTEIRSSTGELSQKAKKLEGLKKSVMDEMRQMEQVFSESRSGMAEINTGTRDILDRMTKIGELTRDSKNKMQNLDRMLKEFTTG